MKIFKVLKGIIFVLFIASMSSCTHSFYAPNDNIMVQLKDKNEFTVSGSLAEVNNVTDPAPSRAINTVQAGYSPIKHLALAGSYFSLKDIVERDNPATGKGHISNIALGTYYFLNFGDLKNKNVAKKDRVYSAMEPCGMLFDLYAGYGEGNVENTYKNGGESYFEFQNYFIQGGVHFKSPFVDVGFSLKKSLLNYYNGHTNYEILNSDQSNIDRLIFGNPYNPLNFNFRVAGGFKYGKVYLNFNRLIDYNSQLPSEDGNVVIGMQVSVHDIVKGFKKI